MGIRVKDLTVHFPHFGPSTFNPNQFFKPSLRGTVHFQLFWTVHFQSFWTVHFPSIDRPLYPGTVHFSMFGPSTFDGPSTFGTVHFPHFAPSTFTPTLSEARSPKKWKYRQNRPIYRSFLPLQWDPYIPTRFKQSFLIELIIVFQMRVVSGIEPQQV